MGYKSFLMQLKSTFKFMFVTTLDTLTDKTWSFNFSFRIIDQNLSLSDLIR